MDELFKHVSILINTYDHCSLMCPFLNKKEKIFSCILYYANLSYDTHVIYRTGKCKNEKN